MPYLSTLEVCSQGGAVQISVYLYLYLIFMCCVKASLKCAKLLPKSLAKRLQTFGDLNVVHIPYLCKRLLSGTLCHCVLDLLTHLNLV